MCGERLSGFIANRILIPMINEAIWLLRKVLGVEDQSLEQRIQWALRH